MYAECSIGGLTKIFDPTFKTPLLLSGIRSRKGRITIKICLGYYCFSQKQTYIPLNLHFSRQPFTMDHIANIVHCFESKRTAACAGLLERI